MTATRSCGCRSHETGGEIGSEGVEEQVDDGVVAGWGGADCVGHGANHVIAGCASCDEDGLDGLEEGLACQSGIRGHQCDSRREEQRSCDGGLGFASPCVAVQAIGSGHHHRVRELRFGPGDQGVHLDGRAAGERRLGGGEAAHGRPFWGWAEFSRAAQEGGGGVVASSLNGSLRAPLQDGGDFFVPPDCCRRQVPRPPVTVFLASRWRRRALCGPPSGRPVGPRRIPPTG